MNNKAKRVYLGFEFVLLFFGVPLFMYFDSGFIHPSVVLLPIIIAVVLILWYSTNFRLKELIAFNVSTRDLIRNGLFVLLSGLIMLLAVLLFDRDNLFNLPAANIGIWFLLCVFYPVFSAYAQEIIYRTFLFKRYNQLFKNERFLTVASGVTFSFVHIVYYSPVSMILTLFAGLFLAQAYSKTRSVLFTAILHGLLGDIVFTVGLGQYFWLDMVTWL